MELLYLRRKKIIFIIVFSTFLVAFIHILNSNFYINQFTKFTEQITKIKGGAIQQNINNKIKKQLFSKQINEFIKQTNIFKVNVFLTDPLLLFHLTDEKERQILFRNELLSKSSLIDRQYCVSFGIHSTGIQEFKQKINPILNEWSFVETIIEGRDGSQRHFNKSDSDISVVKLHMFYTKNSDCIQISVFYRRHDFLWIGSIPEVHNKFVETLEKDIHFGRHEMAFNLFALKTITINDERIGVLAPNESTHFIAQFKTSEFIECDFKTAQHLHKTYANATDILVNERKDRKVRVALIALYKVAKKLNIPLFIASGTLLGWYRQCGVIPYIGDVDTATWAMYASEETTEKWQHNGQGLKLTYVFGFVNNGYEYTFFTKDDLRVDLFYTYKEGVNLTYTGHVYYVQPRKYFRYNFPMFTLCSAELLGLKVLVPCTPVSVVSAEYGQNWTEIKRHWSYRTSPTNVGPEMLWATKEENELAYRHYH